MHSDSPRTYRLDQPKVRGDLTNHIPTVHGVQYLELDHAPELRASQVLVEVVESPP